MPPIQPDNAKPGTLIDLLGAVRDCFEAAADATTIQIGAQYVDQWGEGHGPRVLFVPDPPNAGGKITGAINLGNPASQVHACDVYVRADEETDDDLTRANLIYLLSDRVIGFVSTEGSGHVEWGNCSDDSPLKTSSGLGAGLAYGFTYRRDIRHDAARWAATPRNRAGAALAGPMTSPADTSPPVLPTSPAAVLGAVGTVSVTPVVE
jgi:hypothetical protein